MNREELKQWLITWLSGNVWQSSHTQKIKFKYKDKYTLIIELTSYLQNNCSISERVFHIIHDLYSIKKCPDCSKRPLEYRGPSVGYRQRCGKCNYIHRKECIDPNTGLTISQMIAKKAANTMLNNTDVNGKTTYDRAHEKATNTMKDNIDSEGKNGYDRVHEKATKTKRKTIDENGKSVYDKIGSKISEWCAKVDEETGLSNAQKRGIVCVESKNNIIDPKTGFNMHKTSGLRSLQTKIKNGTLLMHTSTECTNMIKEIISNFNLDKNINYKLYYGDKFDKTKKEWFSSVSSTHIKYALYDFVIRDKQTKNPIMVIEYHGSAFHINDEVYKQLLLDNADNFDPYGNSLRNSYEKDQIKKQHMLNKYKCHYIEVFDYEWKKDKQRILHGVKEKLCQLTVQ